MFKYENNKIETERLILRRFCKEDAAKVAKICNTENKNAECYMKGILKNIYIK